MIVIYGPKLLSVIDGVVRVIRESDVGLGPLTREQEEEIKAQVAESMNHDQASCGANDTQGVTGCESGTIVDG